MSVKRRLCFADLSDIKELIFSIIYFQWLCKTELIEKGDNMLDIFGFKILDGNKPVSVIGLNKGAQASYVWNLLRVSNSSILVVTNTLYEANDLYKSVSDLTDNVLLFPMDDFLTSEALAISPDLEYTRLDTINNILVREPVIVVTNLMGYLRFLPTCCNYKKYCLSIKEGDIIEVYIMEEIKR